MHVFLWKYSKQIHGPSLNDFFVFFMFAFLSFLCNLDINLLLDQYLPKISSYSVGCVFTWLTISLVLQSVYFFSFVKFYVWIASLISRANGANGVLFKGNLPMFPPSRAFHAYSSISFRVLDSMLKFLINLSWFLCRVRDNNLFYSSTGRNTIFLAPFLTSYLVYNIYLWHIW